MNKYDLLKQELQKRILVLDGAMGTMIQTYNLNETDYRGNLFINHQKDLKGNNDILSLTQPDIISKIHESYLTAGADIITTNSFNATAISQADYQMSVQVYEMNLAAAKLARKVADKFSITESDKPRFVAGSFGPTNRTCSISPVFDNPGYRNINFDQLCEAYKEQARGLLDGGADIFLIETIFDTLNAKAALYAIRELLEERGLDVPIWLSATISDNSGRLLIGQTLEAFLIATHHAKPFCVGLNCSLGAEAMRGHIENLANLSDTYISIHPNAGLPNELGKYNEEPEYMAAILGEYAANGWINIVGGCCGTTPDHIRAIAKAVKGISPRKLVSHERYCRLSGLEQLSIKPDSLFVNIGERTNIMGSAKFARLIKAEKYDEALSIAKDQINNGAQVIDINMDEAMIDSADVMVKFLNYIASEPDICRVPVMLDSSRWEVIVAGLKCLSGKGIVNSISLKNGAEEFKHRANFIRKLGAAVIVMAFDEQGQADTYERKIGICTRSYRILVDEVGFPPEDIILDPNIFAVGTGIKEHNEYAVSYIKTCETIKNTLPYALISGGVSNLSFAFRGNDIIRSSMHSVFLYHAIKAGMDMGIVNPAQLTIYDEIPSEYREAVEDVILNRREDATERLISLAKIFDGVSTKERIEEQTWRKNTVEERLAYALIHGITDYLKSDIHEARQKYPSALRIIEGPLMRGMNIVSELFGSGKMFLPQVIKSSRVMKETVSIIGPFMDSEKNGKPIRAGKILLATVKGDVHDIGKNIVGIVLRCNNYEIIDLGVMVSADIIVETARKEDVDIIGLSGLITPSLEEMENVAKEMKRQGLTIPLMIGGATTSKIHTAARIAPLYHGPSIHVENASRSVVVVNDLMNKKGNDIAVQDYKHRHDIALSKNQSNKIKNELLSLEEARKRKFNINWQSHISHTPEKLGVTVLKDFPIEELVPYINWPQFLKAWGLHAKQNSDKTAMTQSERVIEDARKLLQRIIDNKLLRAKAAIGLFPANGIGDDIAIYSNDDRTEVKAINYNLRQQEDIISNKFNLCLSDFIAPKESGVKDYIGAFALSVGFGANKLSRTFEYEGDDYNLILTQSLADRLTEAFSEKLHFLVRTKYWGYAKDEKDNETGIINKKYIGIRPAPGYPSCPDHSEKRTIFNLLETTANTGIELTENCALIPAASVAGWYIAHPQAFNFSVSKIGDDQLADYAGRKGILLAEASRWLRSNLPPLVNI